MTESEEKLHIDAVLESALAEDLGDAGDITSRAIFNDSDQGRALIKSKSSGILSGCCLLEPLFRKISSGAVLEFSRGDGDPLVPGTVICSLEGPVKTILAGERVALNFLQRLSGIATCTSTFVNAIAHTGARLLDTRKTTPGLRYLEKKAVRDGGGINHRFGLFDMLLIKDTHVSRAGGVVPALQRALDYRAGHDTTLKIEIEVQSIAECTEVLRLHPDRIMLDNMSVSAMADCVRLRDTLAPAVELEASGNVTLDSIGAVAESGVDFISSGAITHSAPSLDIHLVIVERLD